MNWHELGAICGALTFIGTLLNAWQNNRIELRVLQLELRVVQLRSDLLEKTISPLQERVASLEARIQSAAQ